MPTPYERKAADVLSTPHASVATCLKGIGWALLAMTEGLLAVAQARRPEPAGLVELTHGEEEK